MRPAHILEPGTTVRGYPKRVIAFDTETHDNPTVLTMGWALFGDRTRGSDITRFDKNRLFFTTADQFWDFVESKLVKKQTTYLVAHNVAFDLANVQFLEQLVARKYHPIEQFIPEANGPFRMTFEKDGKTLRIIDSHNWYTGCSVREIGDHLGFPKGEPQGCGNCLTCQVGQQVACRIYRPDNGCVEGSSVWDELKNYCLRDTEIVLLAVWKWIEFCEVNELGASAMTLAGQSMKAFKHRFMTHQIYLHDNVAVTKLEQDSYCGGLTNNFKCGRWVCQLIIADVKSMYPSRMVTVPVPTKLVYHTRNTGIGQDVAVGGLSPQGRVDWLDMNLRGGYAAVARVVIDTTGRTEDPRWLACAPLLHDSKLMYPVGRFTTTLCTPELKVCLQRGVIADVQEVALYEQNIIFTDYVSFFFHKRQEYAAAGDKIMEKLCKLFLNALYGKFAECTYEWFNIDEDLGADKTEKHVDVDTGEVTYLRQMGGVCQQRSTKKMVGQNSFIAIASHITSAGRVHLNSLIEVAGYDNVGYCDTDSVFTNADGRRNLENAGLLFPKGKAELGQLELELECDTMVLNTLKDYECLRGGIVVKSRLKGVRKDATRGIVVDGEFQPDPEGPSYRQNQFQRIAGALREGNLTSVHIGTVVKTPTHRYTKGDVDHNGTVWPWKLSLCYH